MKKQKTKTNLNQKKGGSMPNQSRFLFSPQINREGNHFDARERALRKPKKKRVMSTTQPVSPPGVCCFSLIIQVIYIYIHYLFI